MNPERAPVDGVAIGVMVLLTGLWGFQQVTVKWIAADVPLVMGSALFVSGLLRESIGWTGAWLIYAAMAFVAAALLIVTRNRFLRAART